jgi:hypothetical protein
MATVLTFLTGILIAAVSSWITVNLALRRYHSERWWDRKVEAYTAVLNALHDSKAFSDRNLAAMERGNELPDEKTKELINRAQKATDQILRAIDLGSFLLSEEALARLRRFRTEESAASDADSWWQHLEDDHQATSSCLEDMIKIAKNDLQQKTSFLWW